ncbi:MAG: hypothetical protein AAF483_14290 [Planctomycetota bacterium]
MSPVAKPPQTKVALEGPGYFQWNMGAWFGSQIGGTAWLLLGAGLLATRSVLMASIWFVVFLIANGIGSWLWFSRDRLQPYPAVQVLLLTCGLAGLMAWTSVVLLRPDFVPLMQAKSIWTGYICLLIFPGMMLSFHFKEAQPKRFNTAEDISKAQSGER